MGKRVDGEQRGKCALRPASHLLSAHHRVVRVDKFQIEIFAVRLKTVGSDASHLACHHHRVAGKALGALQAQRYLLSAKVLRKLRPCPDSRHEPYNSCKKYNSYHRFHYIA